MGNDRRIITHSELFDMRFYFTCNYLQMAGPF